MDNSLPNKPLFIEAICCLSPSDMDRAQQIAQRFGLPLTTQLAEAPQLVIQSDQLSIHVARLGKPISVDFLSGKNAHRLKFGGGKGQPLAKAIGIKAQSLPRVLDATAGFARDGFVIASLGCEVRLIEQNPFLSLLIEDAILHAANDSNIAAIAGRMQVYHSNAIYYLEQLPQAHMPDVIYMDPMYPSRDKSALVKKDMQLLHEMVGADTESDALLTAALSKAKKRVVVKRPKGAEFVGNQQPSVSISSKNTRYDIYVTL